MSVFSDMKMYARFGWGLRSFLQHPIALEQAQAIVKQRLAERESNFLRLVERGIFGYTKSPYLPLLKVARCELGDLRNMVRTRGLDATLLALRQAGAYVTFEEFKGREPIIRDGQVIPVHAADFDNPYLRHYYEAETGGSTGAGTRVAIDLDHIASSAVDSLLSRHAYGTVDFPHVIWRGALPDGTGMGAILYACSYNRVPQKWFSYITSQNIKPALRFRIATFFFIILGRLYGTPIPWPEPLHADQASVLARWVARSLQPVGTCVITTPVSMGVRVAIAARQEGLDLAGAVFICGGEPVTPAKVREITSSGARIFPSYFSTETGPIGLGCANPADSNDLHFMRDALALVQYPRQVPGSDIIVDAFHYTTLLPTMPKIMLNVETDDYGIIENRSCGCLMESYGFTTHLRQIRSFRKLTSEGVTLVGSDMIRILEEVLPTRFGGSPLDYQLQEEEDEHGYTRLYLVVSPKIEIQDENLVVETVLEALRQSNIAADVARAIWSQANTLRVKRTEPVWTERGKMMSIHRVIRTDASR